VEASVAGTSRPMRLDSGAGACTLPRAALDALGFAGKAEANLPIAVSESRPRAEQVFVLEGPGALGFPWFLGRRVALAPGRETLLVTGLK